MNRLNTTFELFKKKAQNHTDFIQKINIISYQQRKDLQQPLVVRSEELRAKVGAWGTLSSPCPVQSGTLEVGTGRPPAADKPPSSGGSCR